MRRFQNCVAQFGKPRSIKNRAGRHVGQIIQMHWYFAKTWENFQNRYQGVHVYENSYFWKEWEFQLYNYVSFLKNVKQF